MQVTEEFVELVPMKGTTTRDDIFLNLLGALDIIGVDWLQMEHLKWLVEKLVWQLSSRKNY